MEVPGRWDVLTTSQVCREHAAVPWARGQPPLGYIAAKGLLHSLEAAWPRHEGPHSLTLGEAVGCRQGKGHLLLCVLTLVALMSALVFWILEKISLKSALYSGWLCSSRLSTASTCWLRLFSPGLVSPWPSSLP